MSKNKNITLFCFDEEIGRLGIDENTGTVYFQYNTSYLQSGKYQQLFPDTGVLKRIEQVQVINSFKGETFRGLPPMIADSLPDVFGNLIFKTWLESKKLSKISVLEQLAYVGSRGMGALEYQPSKKLDSATSIDLSEIAEVVKLILEQKENTVEHQFTNKALLNIFKIGSSAGGVRPKVLVSEHKVSGQVIPGVISASEEYNHYLVKLSIDEELGYNREQIEYCYYLTATHLGIDMMKSDLTDGDHFRTLRYDRKNGKKQHVLTACGLTGWDYKSETDSSYENLFKLALYLRLPHAEIEDLFKRMVFNVVFANTDDHLKNHSFIYDEIADKWHLSPAYDLTYSLNPLLNYTSTRRALSINGKRSNITLSDLKKIADEFSVKRVAETVKQAREAIEFWKQKAEEIGISNKIAQLIIEDFNSLD